MAQLGDGKANQEAKEIREELSFILNAVSSIGDKLVTSFQDAVDEANNLNSGVEIVGKTLKRGLAADLKETVKNTEDLIRAQVKAEKGLLNQSDIQKLSNKLAENRILFEARKNIALKEGVELSKEETEEFEKQLDLQDQALESIKQHNKISSKTFGLMDLALDSAKGFANKLDKSGKLAKILNNDLNTTQKLTLGSQAAFALLVNGIFQASDNIAAVAKGTGVSYKEAKRLQESFATMAMDSGKLFINSKDLNKAFGELSEQTGLIADFGGETLVTQATLTKQLGMSGAEAGKLSLLSRLQGKDTETTLKNTVKTVGQISKQNGVALNAKSILKEISNVSAATAVSLGKNPIALAEAAAQAQLFGANLATIDNIASSLLNFEDSITKELEAELLLGKDINLEKARQMALNNDLAGLSEELANNEEIINSFATGNRIQQEANAAALGLSRDQLAEIALQQEYNNLSAEAFKETYGDVTYEQLQSQSASEKFAATLEAIQGVIGDLGTAYAPFLDALASTAGYMAKNKGAALALVGVLSGLAALSIASSIANIYSSFAQIPLGVGIPIAVATTMGLIATIAKASSMMKTEDDMIAPPGYGDRILSTPKGSIALNNQDTIVAGTNLGRGGGGNTGQRTNQLLEMLINQKSVFKIGTDEFYTSTSKYSYQIQ